MKKQILKFSKAVLAGVALFACTAVFAASFTVPTQAPRLIVATNLPSIVNVATVSNTTSYIKIPKNSGGISAQFITTSSAGNSNAIVYLKPSVDGTNGASTAWVWIQPPSAGTTPAVGWTNWSEAQLSGLDGFFVTGITNGHASGILTNRGLIFRPANP